jgi:hypothetical protein
MNTFVSLADYTQEDHDFYHSLKITIIYDDSEAKYYAQVEDADGFTIIETDFDKSKFEVLGMAERQIWEKMKERVLRRRESGQA